MTAYEIRRLVGKTLANSAPFGYKAALAAEVLIRGCELCSVLVLSIGQGMAAMLILGLVAVLIEYVARRLMKSSGQRPARKRGRATLRKPLAWRAMPPKRAFLRATSP